MSININSSSSSTNSSTNSDDNNNNNKDEPPLPYWLVNVPPSQWPTSCPPYLQNLPAKSIQVLSTPDSQFRPLSWPEVRNIVQTNRIDQFQRTPSNLLKYLQYTWKLRQRHGSVIAFVLAERLHWDPRDLLLLLPSKSQSRSGTRKGIGPFVTSLFTDSGEDEDEDEDNVKILFNDWPYGVEEGIVHLVVWTKFELEEVEGTDNLTPEAREAVEMFVARYFWGRCGRDNVVWFKNWTSLKSVKAVEHFHIMIKDPDPEFIKEITKGDVPMIERVL